MYFPKVDKLVALPFLYLDFLHLHHNSPHVQAVQAAVVCLSGQELFWKRQFQELSLSNNIENANSGWGGPTLLTL
jgi:hypothetical protein